MLRFSFVIGDINHKKTFTMEQIALNQKWLPSIYNVPAKDFGAIPYIEKYKLARR